ncbi:MAG TPA: Crp/Fnr family transcriptional regulator [Flavisolibacter sp.]|jgi:CRP/FNR family transcriptional regulator|nr:Crp/Fnr family transcriptional regulator [Flavisolibacter sp.]
MCSFCIPEWKELIALNKRTILIKKGKQIFIEGEKVNGIFFLYSGFVKVHKQWGDQKDLILRFARQGDILGHRGLGGTNLYPISATAMEDSKVCFITNEFLETTLKTNPDFTYQLMHFYASELQKAEHRMRNLALMEVKGRIAEALLDLARLAIMPDNTIVINRQDIASYAGTTYETVFKFFKELEKKGIITTSGKTIKINQPDELGSLI